MAVAELRPALEAILMVSDEPLDTVRLASVVGHPVEAVEAALEALAGEYAEQGRGFDLRNVAGGWRFYSRPEFAGVVESFVLEGQQARLTRAALETLSVVAYKQPVSRARVSAIRGVNVDGVMRTLLTRGLVEEAGQDELSGANLYRTTSYFLERIGVTSLDELPELAPYLPDMDDLEDELASVAGLDARARAGAGPARPDVPPAPQQPQQLRARLARRHRARRRDRDHPASQRPDTDEDGLIRLQKLLAQSGVASRRKCEELMLDGLVEVDGEVVTRLGTKVDPRTAVIRVEGKRLPPISDKVYLVLHKPRGVVSTMSDPEGRRTLGDLVAERPERLFHVGRLDTDTEGLIILTNDGDFAQRLAHPSHEVDKTYVAEVDGEVHVRTIRELLAGVTLEDGPVTVTRARVLGGDPRREGSNRSIVELTIHEGRNRIVRRLLAHVGHPVRRLTRTQIGPITLARLRSGEMRELTVAELGELMDSAQL